MGDLTREEAGWALARVWLDALEDTARDFFGNRPRIFARRAYEHAAEGLIRILEKDYGIKAEPADSIKAAIDSYIDLGVHGGIFADKSDFGVVSYTPSRVEVTVYKCPYFDSCAHLINEGVPVSNITCPRIGCFAAAANILAKIDSIYEVHQVKLDGGCSGAVMKA
jgi:hypothetical protein